MDWSVTRRTRRSAFLRLLALSLVVGVSAWADGFSPAHAASWAAQVPENSFCYSWTFRNYTPDDVNGLEASFVDPSGSGVASGIYTGTGHPFDTVVLTSAVAPSVTRISYSNGSVPIADEARVGFCNRLADSQPSFAWSSNGSAAQPAPRTLGVVWGWSKPGQLRVQLTNQQALPLIVTSLWLYDGSAVLTPEELTLDATASMQPVANLSEDVLTLAPNVSQTLDVQFDATSGFVPQPNQPFVLAAVFAPEDDLSDESVLMLQAYSPQAAYLPMLMKE